MSDAELRPDQLDPETTKDNHRRVSIATYSGVEFFPLSPRVEDIRLFDIAHALSMKCRYTGHCHQFFCPTPDQRVLTANLEWKPSGDLVLGEELFAFDEEPTEPGSCGVNRRRFRPAIVTHLEPVKRKIIRLEMSDGSTVRSSEEHPWLIATKASRNQRWQTAREIASALQKERPRALHKALEPWGFDASREGGWLAGMFDGEGYISFTNRKGTMCGVSQNPGPVLDRLVDALKREGVDFSVLSTGAASTLTCQIKGGWRGVLTLLGRIQPGRLVGKVRGGLRDGTFNKQYQSPDAPRQVLRYYEEGEEWVTGIETSTHTYICEGYGAHNSVAQHSIMVSQMLEVMKATVEEQYIGLMHDASEAYLPDVASPIKGHIPGYREIEQRLEAVIAEAFNFEFPHPKSIKVADAESFRHEYHQIMPSLDWWEGDPPKYDWGVIEEWMPFMARERFIQRHRRLAAERDVLITGAV